MTTPYIRQKAWSLTWFSRNLGRTTCYSPRCEVRRGGCDGMRGVFAFPPGVSVDHVRNSSSPCSTHRYQHVHRRLCQVLAPRHASVGRRCVGRAPCDKCGHSNSLRSVRGGLSAAAVRSHRCIDCAKWGLPCRCRKIGRTRRTRWKDTRTAGRGVEREMAQVRCDIVNCGLVGFTTHLPATNCLT